MQGKHGGAKLGSQSCFVQPPDGPCTLCPAQLTAAEVRRLEQAEEGRAALVDSLDGLKQRVANVE